MTLSEIDAILEDLAKRHVNLDKQLLTTLLLAAGWEGKLIRDAVAIFEQNQKNPPAKKETTPETKTAPVIEKETVSIKSVPTPVVLTSTLSSERSASLQKENLPVEKKVETPLQPLTSSSQVTTGDMTFYKPDGEEEGKLHAFVDVPKIDTRPLAPLERIVVVPQENTPIKKEIISKVGLNPVEVVQEPEVVTGDHEITFYNHDGQEEGELHAFTSSQDTQKQTVATVPISKVEEIIVPKVEVQKDIQPHAPIFVEAPKKEPEVIPKPVAPIYTPVMPERKEFHAPATPPIQKEPESLIIHEAVKKPQFVQVEPAHIPDNLPLLPFESSPHVWSFSKYKDTFHGEVMPHTVEELSQKKPTGQAPSHEGDEISLEKTPMTKGDESLVFLAGVMLLVIILILGYMYSNGRL